MSINNHLESNVTHLFKSFGFKLSKSSDLQQEKNLPPGDSKHELQCCRSRFLGVLFGGWRGFRVRQPFQQPTDAQW